MERQCVRRQQARAGELEALWRLAAEASVAQQRVSAKATLKRKLPVAWEKGFAAGKADEESWGKGFDQGFSAGKRATDILEREKDRVLDGSSRAV